MYFTGGCPPFSWTGNNVSFVDHAGIKIDKDTLKKTRALYVKSDDECSGSVKVYEVCGENLSREKSIVGQVGTVVGPLTLNPGDIGTFYNDLGPSAVYTGTLEMVQQSGNGAVLRMPAGASGSYTASWTASCGRTASRSVLSGSECTAPTSGAGSPVGQIVSLNNGQYCAVVGAICGTVSYPLPPNADVWVVLEVPTTLNVGDDYKYGVAYNLYQELPAYSDCAVLPGPPASRVTRHKITITQKWW